MGEAERQQRYTPPPGVTAHSAPARAPLGTARATRKTTESVDGTPYCSSEGLEPWAEYLVTDAERDSLMRVWRGEL